MSEGDLRTALDAVADIERPLVVDLDDAAAIDAALTGGKAAALARGRTAGLASLPGVVLTTAFSDAIDAGADVASHPAVREAFERAGGDQQGARRPQLVGGRGHGDVVDGRPVRVGHRHPRLRRLRRRRDGGAGLPDNGPERPSIRSRCSSSR